MSTSSLARPNAPIRASATALPSTSYPVERFRLPNGLRVALSPDRSAPVIAVVVVYDVGLRSEPEGRTGFAHLFEHLMFGGSENVEKLGHFRYIQSAGGTFNGSTHFDFTEYRQTLPSNALSRTLFLEADRMRAPLLTQEALQNQIGVVKEEIRLNVRNRPYGGFPWCFMPAVMFDTFPNAHDGYGSFEDLDAATVDDARSFFDTYYAPENAVLTVVGDIDITEATKLIEQHFGHIPARPAPKRPSFAEPDLIAERRGEHHDPLAPLPALAMAWRVPDPIEQFHEYLGYVLLAEVLTDGDSSRLVERMVLRDAIASSVAGYLSFFGDVLGVRDPTVLILEAHYSPQYNAQRVISTIHEELDRIATDGIAYEELDRARTRLVAQILREADSALDRAVMMSVFEQQRGRAELINDLPRLLAAVTADEVRAAAARLRPERQTVLELVPGKDMK